MAGQKRWCSAKECMGWCLLDLDSGRTCDQIREDEGRKLFRDLKLEEVKHVGDLRKAIEGLPDDAQMFVNVPGMGEDFAIQDVWASQQIPESVSKWPTDERTVGVEIHLGLFPERETEDA